ncbi:MAG: hypothetical protein PHU75_03915 [Candidatus Nanopelagicales bacterium]|nr:hypothetical protein [Candidatus Nanopelagicales bacterium]
MRRITLLVVIAAITLAAGLATAQPVPDVCYNPTTGACEGKMPGFACPEGYAPIAGPCPVVATPIPEPTVAPDPTAVPPVPTVAPPFEPHDIEVPGFFSVIVSMFSPKNPLPVGWGMLAAGILTGLVAALRQLLALFGAKLGARGIFIATTVLGALAAIGAVVSDGVISGGDEWSALLIAVVSIPVAFFGYRILYSDAAKARVN